MKRILFFSAMAAVALVASAQRANDADASWVGGSVGGSHPSSYNLLGVSYDNTGLNGKNFEFVEEHKSMSLNGFGLEYTRGFSLSSVNPMYLEAGIKLNMGFGSKSFDDIYESEKESVQMMRLSVPVSFAWRFAAGDNFAITPYVGIDFRVNVMGRAKYEEVFDGSKTEYDWVNIFDEDEMGEDGKWNRFQMGWHVGARAEYSRAFLGISYGTDFIKAYSYSEDGYKSHVNTGNLAVTVGYRF